MHDDGVSEIEQWYTMPSLPESTIPMPIAAAFNDITQNICIHRHVGLVWYARDHHLHKTAPGWVLRFHRFLPLDALILLPDRVS